MSEITDPPAKKINAWMDGKSFGVSHEMLALFKKLKKPLECKLCGKSFTLYDRARWIYCNSTPGQHTGNFFVCGVCDGHDVMKRGEDQLALAVKLAKRWGIYGPDWERDCG